MQQEDFKRIRALFGEMDDLCQERRRAFTGWVAQTIPPEEFLASMRRNLQRTRETTEALATLIQDR